MMKEPADLDITTASGTWVVVYDLSNAVPVVNVAIARLIEAVAKNVEDDIKSNSKHK